MTKSIPDHHTQAPISTTEFLEHHQTIDQIENRTGTPKIWQTTETLHRIGTKLSLEQITLLSWLSQGHSVDICTEISNDLGNTELKEEYPGKFNRRSIYRLKQWGLLKETDIYPLGIRWTSITINAKGNEVVRLLEASQVAEDAHA